MMDLTPEPADKQAGKPGEKPDEKSAAAPAVKPAGTAAVSVNGVASAQAGKPAAPGCCGGRVSRPR
ncbi:hypothetical protein V6L77_09945 [Pannonibacter sp. Pt2-lr]